MNEVARNLLRQIKDAAEKVGDAPLTYQRFREITGVSCSRILRSFDSWTEACSSAGVQCGQASPNNITPRYSKGRDHAIQEVKRIAKKLGVDTLSKAQFDRENPAIKACTVVRLCGGWKNALQAAGLRQHPLYHEKIGLAELASEFLQVVLELGRIPTVHQMARRSVHGMNTFTRKFGGYSAFKQKAIGHLLAHDELTLDVRRILEREQERSGVAGICVVFQSK